MPSLLRRASPAAALLLAAGCSLVADLDALQSGAGGEGGLGGFGGEGGLGDGGEGGLGDGGGASGPGGGGEASSASAGPGGEGGGGSLACDDPHPEPNETEGAATAFPEQVNCFPIEEARIEGLAAGKGDVDFHRISGIDVCGSDADATRPTLVVEDASPTTGFCMFADCATGVVPSVGCQSGSESAFSENNVKGCCSDGSFSMSVVCTPGSGTLTRFFVEIRESADACTPYTFTFTYTK